MTNGCSFFESLRTHIYAKAVRNAPDNAITRSLFGKLYEIAPLQSGCTTIEIPSQPSPTAKIILRRNPSFKNIHAPIAAKVGYVY